jgi:hypothetical protein
MYRPLFTAQTCNFLHYVDNALEQEDPFEDEEDLVLPLRPECFAVAQQGEIVQHLLHDLHRSSGF